MHDIFLTQRALRDLQSPTFLIKIIRSKGGLSIKALYSRMFKVPDHISFKYAFKKITRRLTTSKPILNPTSLAFLSSSRAGVFLAKCS